MGHIRTRFNPDNELHSGRSRSSFVRPGTSLADRRAMFSFRIKNRFNAAIRIGWILCMCMILTSCAADPFSDQIANSQNSTSTVGSASSSFISANPFRELIIEVAFVEGHAPRADSLRHLVRFLKAHIQKPGGIRIIKDPPIPRNNVGRLSLSDIHWYEKLYRKNYSSEETIVAFFMFLDASYDTDTDLIQTFGLAFNESAVAIFVPPISQMLETSPSLDHHYIESTILTHEFGHLLGLVGMGAPLKKPHVDKSVSNRGHCSNSRCLMYYAINTTLSLVVGRSRYRNVIPDLDGDCKSDLKAAGGK